jgi:hypothetical protein
LAARPRWRPLSLGARRARYDPGMGEPSSADRQRYRSIAVDSALVEQRLSLGRFVARAFSELGNHVHVVGHIGGDDRRNGVSVGGHGSDETVGVSVLLRIGGQLVSASTDLFADGRAYAAAALTRQLVEIEYLAWAFQFRGKDAERWLRSTREQRWKIFRPKTIQNAAAGRFRRVDYSEHCELGGHPTPGGTMLLREDLALHQLLLADMLGHAEGIWNHLQGWACNQSNGSVLADRRAEVDERFASWRSTDPLVRIQLPSAP